jgi:peptidyl-tRNA hydrolase, PTH2 family
VARWPRVQRDSTENPDAVGLSDPVSSGVPYPPILEGSASGSPPNREFRPQDFRPFVPIRSGHLTGPSVCPRHILGAMTEIPPAEADRRPTKQVIVIRRDLRMRRGKEIAQGAHAATAWLADRVLQTILPNEAVDHVALSPAERAWLESSFRKVTVKVNSEEELIAVYQKALDAGLVVHLITDRGLTEFGGVPTRTCLAVGPDYDDLIDPVTGDLELY